MKKNFSVNIQGRLFHIDEDAYALLELYIAHLNDVFSEEPSREAIIADFQKRISQKLHDQLKHLKTQIVSIEIVKQLLADFGFEENTNDTAEPKSATTKDSETYKRLFRHPENRYLGGVCGGIAAYFSIDPIIVRIIFVVFTAIFAVGLLAYLILWFVVPLAASPIERLHMKGERISADRVKQMIKEELKEVEKSFEKLKKDTLESEATGEMGRVFQYFFRFPVIVRFMAGSILIAIALFFVSGLLVLLVPPLNLGSYEGMNIASFQHLGQLLFHSSIMGSFLQWSIIAIFVIPFAGVLVFGVSLITGLTLKTSVGRWVSQYVGTLSLLFVVFCIVWIYIQFLFLHKQEKRLTMHGSYYSEYVLDVKEESVPLKLKGKPVVSFEPAAGDTLTAIVQTRAYGRNSLKAAENTNDIILNIETSRDTVFVSSVWYSETNAWRGQNAKVVLSIPVGKRIRMTQAFVDSFVFSASADEQTQKKNRFRMTKDGPEKI